MTQEETEVYDVIVVGAGLAGLSAAKELKKEGLNYLVLEATDRSGGKVLSNTSEDSSHFFELGAQFVNQDMTEVTSLIKETGMDLEESYITENSVMFNEENELLDEVTFEDLEEMLKDTGNKENVPLSKLLEEWIENNDELNMMKSFIASEATVNSDYINTEAFKNMFSRVTTTEHEEKYQASGPLMDAVKHLENQSLDSIQYDKAVESVSGSSDGYTVKTTNGQTFTSKGVIMAIPPTVANKLTFSDNLYDYYSNELKSYIDGSVIKITLAYPDAFWRNYTVDGEQKDVYITIFSENEGINIMDSSKMNGENRLTMFIGGDKARELANIPSDARVLFALERLIKVFGGQAEQYEELQETVWVDSRFYGGGFGSMIHHEGDHKTEDILREPHNNMVFSSTELALEFPHYMEGALRSGQYAVKRLIEEWG